MGEIYTMSFDDVATGSDLNTYDSICQIIVDDTALKRVQLLEIILGPGDAVPIDLSAGLQIKRIADYSAGSAGSGGTAVTAANMARARSDLANPPFTGRYGDTTEPTVYEANPLWQGGINTRSMVSIPILPGLVVAQQDQLIALLIAPRSAAAQQWSGALVVEVF